MSSGFEGLTSRFLSRSPSRLREASLDFGRLYSEAPCGVLRPHSARDIAQVIRWAAPRGIPVAPRGRGHNGSGYAQAAAGIVVDTRSMAAVRRITGTSVEVDAGCDWDTLLARTLPLGLRPPVVPSHRPLSVGGLLAVGGIGEDSFRAGTAGNTVIDFELVTGTGEILTCSRRSQPELFSACLGGFGQFGILTRVRLNLVPVPPRQRLSRLLYTDPAAYAADFARLMARPARVDGLIGSLFPNTRPWMERVMGPASRAVWVRAGEFPWLLVLEVRYRPEAEAALKLDDLASLPAARYDQETAGFVQFDNVPSSPQARNVWLHLMIPADKAAAFIDYVCRTLDVDPETDGPVSVYPIVPARLGDTAFRAPAAPGLLLFDLMPIVAADDAARLARVIECLRETYRFARTLGGMCYPVGALRFTREDWQRHFGGSWEPLRELKRRYDPHAILAPGVGMF